MNIISKICQSGGKMQDGRLINEDGISNFDVTVGKQTYKFVILMDGATGLGKNNKIVEGLTSAEWYVEFIMQQLTKKFSENPRESIKKVTKECIIEVTEKIREFEEAKGIKLAEYEKPSSSLAILRQNRGLTEIFLLGDTETIVGYKNGDIERLINFNQIALQKNDNMVLKRMKEIAEQRNCDVIEAREDEEIQKMLQINREKKNRQCEGVYWTCGTTPEAVEHAGYFKIENEIIDRIILATDGFDYSMLGFDEKEIYNQLKKNSAEDIASQIRALEEEDNRCNKFVRFKKSDDLSLIILG